MRCGSGQATYSALGSAKDLLGDPVHQLQACAPLASGAEAKLAQDPIQPSSRPVSLLTPCVTLDDSVGQIVHHGDPERCFAVVSTINHLASSLDEVAAGIRMDPGVSDSL